MDELIDLLANRNERVSLDVAALQVAKLEHPECTEAPFIALLDSHAAEFAERPESAATGERFVTALSSYLFEELGFRGNHTDYYDPANSCLDSVLTKRTGIPITLSVVYMEIVRRLRRAAQGVNLPGHFVLEYHEPGYRAYVDPFHGGRIRTAAECLDLARSVTGIAIGPEALAPAGKRQIALRMLNNLRAVYLRSQSYRKAVDVLTLLIRAEPHAAEEYKQRAVCYARLEAMRLARSDFERYLQLSPEAEDREQITEYIERATHMLSRLN